MFRRRCFAAALLAAVGAGLLLSCLFGSAVLRLILGLLLFGVGAALYFC